MTGWRAVARQESRDLWVSGRGPLLIFGFSVLLSVITYLAATNQVLDYLAQREAVDLVFQVLVAVGVLVTLVISADGISGERERGTLETLLLAPISRRDIVTGKLVAAMSLWLAAFVVGLPYLWVLGRSAAVVGPALLLGLVLGTLLAFALAAAGLLISAVAGSNRVSLSVSLFVLLALFALTQLPAGPSWIGDALVRLNPIGSALHFASGVLIKGDAQPSYLVSPVLAGILAVAALLAVAPRIVRLTAGVSAQ